MKTAGGLAQPIRPDTVPRLIWEAGLSGQPCALRFIHGGLEKTLFIRDRVVYFARSTDPEDHLGAFLFRQGKITLTEIHDILRDQQPGQRLGTLLVERDVLSSGELILVVLGQLEAIVYSLFHWTEGQVVVEPDVVASEESIVLTTPMETLLLRGIRQIQSVSQVQAALDPWDARLRSNPTSLEAMRSRLPLTMTEGALIEEMGERGWTVQELLEASVDDDFATLKLLWALRLLGGLERVEEFTELEAASSLEGPSPAAVASEPSADSPASELEIARFERLRVLSEREGGTVPDITSQLPGSLARQPFAEVLRDLYEGRRTGFLFLKSRQREKALTLRTGYILFATSNLVEDRVSSLLVRRGLLTDEQRRQAEARHSPGQPFGKTLVMEGFITAETLVGAIKEQIQEIVYSLFDWSSGGYYFLDRDVVDEIEIGSEESTANLIIEGVKCMRSFAPIEASLREMDPVLQYTLDPEHLFQEISLSSTEGFLLTQVDGRLRLSELLALSPLSREETVRLYYGLLSAGILEVRAASPAGAAAPPDVEEAAQQLVAAARGGDDSGPVARDTLDQHVDRLKEKSRAVQEHDHYRTLEVDPSTESAEIRRAYLALVRRYHRDRYLSGGDPGLLELCELVTAALNEAYECLSDPEARAAYDQLRSRAGATPPEAPVPEPAADPQRGSTLLRAGREAYQARDYYQAAELLEAAARDLPEHPEILFLLARAQGKNPHWRKQAEANYLRAIDLNPVQPEYYYHLGWLYKRAGLRLRAQRVFERVLQLEPSHAGAKKELRLLKEKPGLEEMISRSIPMVSRSSAAPVVGLAHPREKACRTFGKALRKAGFQVIEIDPRRLHRETLGQCRILCLHASLLEPLALDLAEQRKAGAGGQPRVVVLTDTAGSGRDHLLWRQLEVTGVFSEADGPRRLVDRVRRLAPPVADPSPGPG